MEVIFVENIRGEIADISGLCNAKAKVIRNLNNLVVEKKINLQYKTRYFLNSLTKVYYRHLGEREQNTTKYNHRITLKNT